MTTDRAGTVEMANVETETVDMGTITEEAAITEATTTKSKNSS